jgi:hypothetical protein
MESQEGGAALKAVMPIATARDLIKKARMRTYTDLIIERREVLASGASGKYNTAVASVQTTHDGSAAVEREFMSRMHANDANKLKLIKELKAVANQLETVRTRKMQATDATERARLIHDESNLRNDIRELREVKNIINSKVITDINITGNIALIEQLKVLAGIKVESNGSKKKDEIRGGAVAISDAATDYRYHRESNPLVWAW